MINPNKYVQEIISKNYDVIFMPLFDIHDRTSDFELSVRILLNDNEDLYNLFTDFADTRETKAKTIEALTEQFYIFINNYVRVI